MGLLRERVSPAAPPGELRKALLRDVARDVVRGRDDVTIRELEAAGVGRTYAATLAASGAIRRVRYGVYGEAGEVGDETSHQDRN